MNKLILPTIFFLLSTSSTIIQCDVCQYNSPERATKLHLDAMFGESPCSRAERALLPDATNVNVRDAKGWTPLFYALLYNQLDFAEKLIKQGAQVNVCDNQGNWLIHQALGLRPNFPPVTIYGNDGQWLFYILEWPKEVISSYSRLQFLLQYGADVTKVNDKKQTLLHQLALADSCSPDDSRESVSIALLLRNYGLDLNRQDMFGATALHYAIMDDHNLFEWLLKHGANPYAVDKAGWNFLHYAAAQGTSAGWWYLYDNKYININVLIDQQDVDGNTPLHIAAANYFSPFHVMQIPDNKLLVIADPLHGESIYGLLEHGADMAIRNDKGQTSEDIAQVTGNLVAQELLAKKW